MGYRTANTKEETKEKADAWVNTYLVSKEINDNGEPKKYKIGASPLFLSQRVGRSVINSVNKGKELTFEQVIVLVDNEHDDEDIAL